MLDKARDAGRVIKTQSEIKKELASFFVSGEKREYEVVIRGDKRIEKLLIDGEEATVLKDLINSLMKKVEKKAEKKTRGMMRGLGIPGID